MTKLIVIAFTAFTILVSPIPAEAQQAGKVYRVGLFDAGAPTPSRKNWWRAFEQKMRELGYVEGRNIVFERRWARAEKDRQRGLARELVDLKVDVIVTASSEAAFAARRATSTIPIVTAIASGSALVPRVVKSLARPGGNVTGMLSFGQELTAKRLELAKEIVPSASRFAILGGETHPGFATAVRATKAGAKSLGVSLLTVGVRGVNELDAAFSTMLKAGIEAVVVAPGAIMGSSRVQLAKLAAKARIPAILPDRRYVVAGSLMGLGSKLPELFRGSAVFVDKILKGANPAELPAERQTRFDLVVNLKTAKALGITIPRSVLLRADKVIE